MCVCVRGGVCVWELTKLNEHLILKITLRSCRWNTNQVIYIIYAECTSFSSYCTVLLTHVHTLIVGSRDTQTHRLFMLHSYRKFLLKYLQVINVRSQN